MFLHNLIILYSTTGYLDGHIELLISSQISPSHHPVLVCQPWPPAQQEGAVGSRLNSPSSSSRACSLGYTQGTFASVPPCPHPPL